MQKALYTERAAEYEERVPGATESSARSVNRKEKKSSENSREEERVME